MSPLSFNVFVDDLCSLPRAQQWDVVKLIWPEPNLALEKYDERDYSGFFKYLEAIKIQHGQYRERLFVGEFKDIIYLLHTLRTQQTQPLSVLIQDLSSRFLNADPKSIRRTLELSARLWLTVNIDSPSVAWSHVAPFEKPLNWPIDMSLDGFVQAQFASSRITQRKVSIRIEGSFTAAYLVDICGMTLNWTDHLSDHLRPDTQHRVLTVYKHKICLLNHLKGPCPIPKHVLEETLNTLNLLFPFGHDATEALCRREGQEALYRLGSCGKDRELDLSSYDCWNQELETLLGIFRQPPRTFKQLAVDRRNLPEYAIFWMTVMVAFITLVSIPCNIIQATYSVKAYQVTVEQDRGCSSS